MGGGHINLLKTILMLSSLLKNCLCYTRPVAVDGLQAVIASPIKQYAKEWVDAAGISYSQPEMTKSDLKIISYNVLGEN